MTKHQDILIVDRIEDDTAICEDENMKIFDIKLGYISGNLREGCIIIKNNSKYFVDEKLTQKREEEIKDLMKGIWEE